MTPDDKPLAYWTAEECLHEIARLADGNRIDAVAGQLYLLAVKAQREATEAVSAARYDRARYQRLAGSLQVLLATCSGRKTVDRQSVLNLVRESR